MATWEPTTETRFDIEDGGEYQDSPSWKSPGTDAERWAEEFMRRVVECTPPMPISKGLMVGWFANAIMAGADAGIRIGLQNDKGHPPRAGGMDSHGATEISPF